MRYCLFILTVFLTLVSGVDARAEGFFHDDEERSTVQLNTSKLDLARKKGIRIASVREVANPYHNSEKLFVPCPQGMVNYDALKQDETSALRHGFVTVLAQSAKHCPDTIHFLDPRPQRESDIPRFARLSSIRELPFPSDLDSEIKSLNEKFTPQEIARLIAFATGKKAMLDKALLDKVVDKITDGPSLQFVLAYSSDEMFGDDVTALTVFSLDGWTFGAGDHTTVTATIRRFFHWPRPTKNDPSAGCFLFMQSAPTPTQNVFEKLSANADNWIEGFMLLNP